MADKEDLWTAVDTRYADGGLIALTNIDATDPTSINTTAGIEAANGVINLWPIYAQVAYDATDQTHVEAAVLGVIAMLWRRGGTSTQIEQVKWDTVFSKDGVIAQVKNTGPRGRRGPKSNSGVSQKAEAVNGRKVRGWSDRESTPTHANLPRRVIAND